jgi:hypothetical protein
LHFVVEGDVGWQAGNNISLKKPLPQNRTNIVRISMEKKKTVFWDIDIKNIYFCCWF